MHSPRRAFQLSFRELFYPSSMAGFLSSSHSGSTSSLGCDPLPSVSGGGSSPRCWGALSLLCSSDLPPPAPDTPQEGGEGAAQRSHMDLGFVLGHPGFALSPAPASSNSSWRAWQVPLSLPQFPYLQIEYWSLPHRAVVRLCERKLCWRVPSRWQSLNK